MSRRTYKNAVDKIVCTDVFRTKMEEKLSLPANESCEYADSVDEVERAKSCGIKRIIGVVAACGVVCVSVGVGFKAIKNSDTEPIGSSSSFAGDSSSISVKYENLPSLIQNFPEMEWGVSYDDGEIVRLNYEQKEALAKMLDKTSWDTDIAMELDREPNHDISLNLLDSEMWYVISLYDNGYITEKYSLSNDDVDCFSDNYWTAEDYEEVYKLLFENNEQAVTEDVTEDVTEETTENNANQTVSELLDLAYSNFTEIESEYYNYSFYKNSGQYSDSIENTFTKKELDEIYWLLRQGDWREEELDSFVYEEFYAMGAMFNNSGQLYLYDENGTGHVFSAKTESISRLYDYLMKFEFDMKSQISYNLDNFKSMMESGEEIYKFKAEALIQKYTEKRDEDSEPYNVDFSVFEGSISNGIVFFSNDGVNTEQYTFFEGVSESEKYGEKTYDMTSEWIRKNGKFLYTESYEADSDISSYKGSMQSTAIEGKTVFYETDSEKIDFDYWALYDKIPEFLSTLKAGEFMCEVYTDYDSSPVTYSWAIGSTTGEDTYSDWHMNLTYDENGMIRIYDLYENGELVESISLSCIDINDLSPYILEYPEIYDTLINE